MMQFGRSTDKRRSANLTTTLSSDLAPDPNRLIVLSSPGPGSPLPNEYNKLLIESLGAHVEVRPFSWSSALTSRFDVLHVHWPDALLHGRSGITRLGKKVAFLALLGRTWSGAVKIVWTVHNLQPHETPRWYNSLLLKGFERLTSAEIHLTEKTRRNRSNTAFVIPHGPYTKVETHSTRQEGLLVCVGQLRPYKGIDLLVSAFTETQHRGKLLIAGEPVSPGYGKQIKDFASNDRRIELSLRRQTELELAELLVSSSGVVIPYRKFANSGVVLHALTYGRPVLVPANEFSEELVAEFGTDWVHEFSPPIQPADIERFAAATAVLPSGGPDLSQRNWDSIARAHVAIFAETAADS